MAQFSAHYSGRVRITEIKLCRLTQNPEPDFCEMFGLFTMLGSKFTKFAFFVNDRDSSRKRALRMRSLAPP